MDLDKMERLASTPIFASDPDADMKRRWRAERLAEVVLQLLPVVRAVMVVEEARLDQSGSGAAHDRHSDALWNLHKAAKPLFTTLRAGRGK